MQKKNGINMQSVRQANRGALLNLIYHKSAPSRKELSSILGLTPAAVSLIIGEMLQEGIVEERPSGMAPSRRGRKEVALAFNSEKYMSIGIYISRTRVTVSCVDFDFNILYSDSVDPSSFSGKSLVLIDLLTDIIEEMLHKDRLAGAHILTGIGVSIVGIVNAAAGISINSYGVIESETNLTDSLQARFGVPVILDNNICALAHAEAWISGSSDADDLFFIKYGPGVGAARLRRGSASSHYEIESIELGHMITDPMGSPCICGSSGCLETIAGYDAIEGSLKVAMNKGNAPKLWQLSEGKPEKIRIPMILQALSAKDPLISRNTNRVLQHLAIAVKNAICLFAPSKVILYGQAFDNEAFLSQFMQQLSVYTDPGIISLSRFNLNLEALSPATLAISQFLDNGGITKLV